MNISDSTRVTLQIGQVLAIIIAIIGGASYAAGIEAKAEQAKQSADDLQTEVKSMRSELQRQRELIAQIQGDTRAILQLTKLRNSSQ